MVESKTFPQRPSPLPAGERPPEAEQLLALRMRELDAVHDASLRKLPDRVGGRGRVSLSQPRGRYGGGGRARELLCQRANRLFPQFTTMNYVYSGDKGITLLLISF